MGVSRVFELKCEEVSKAYQDLLTRIEAFGGNRIGNYKVQCKFFSRVSHPDPTIQQKLIIVRMSSHEDSAYSFLINSKKGGETGVDSKSNYFNEEYLILECGIEGALAIEKLGIFTRKQEVHFEGSEYKTGDFIVRAGIFKGRNNLSKNLVVEVEYTPCEIVGLMDSAIIEFLGYLGESENFVIPIQDSMEYLNRVGLSKKFTSKHRAFQYVTAFNKMQA